MYDSLEQVDHTKYKSIWHWIKAHFCNHDFHITETEESVDVYGHTIVCKKCGKTMHRYEARD